MKLDAQEEIDKESPDPENNKTPWSHFSTSMIGREEDVRHIREMILDPSVRMLTVIGPVGVGKSRVAAAIFPDVSDILTGYCRSVELNGPRTDTELRAELERALPPATTPERAQHRSLLVLDGCGDALDVLPSVLTGLLADRPELTVLLAAPEPLGIYGEDVVRLAPLPVPERADGADTARLHEFPSVRLFVRRAQAVCPGFGLTADNREAVARLCARTDGIPLAIELAAARMKLSSPQDVLDGLAGDLDILSGNGGETLSRHTSMRAAIAWSLTRLRHEEQELLSHIAVFRSGVDAPTAQSVTGMSTHETQRRLERLVDTSLLQTERDTDSGIIFVLPGLTRQYIVEWLRQSGLLTQILHAHADYFLTRAEEVRNSGSGSHSDSRAFPFRRWFSDVEAAMFFLLDSGDHTGAVRMASAFGLYWRGYGGLRKAVDLLTEVLDVGNLPRSIGVEGETALGELLMWMGEHQQAEERLLRARRENLTLGDGSSGEASGTRRLGALAFHRGDTPEAETLLESALNALDVSESAREHSITLRELAECRLVRGDHHSAADAAKRALHSAERLRDTRNAALAECVLADARFAEGMAETAQSHHRSALSRLRELGDRAASAVAIERLAVLWTRCPGQGDEHWRRAVRVMSAAAAMRIDTGCRAPAPLAAAVEDASAQARSRLGEQEYEKSWAVGRALDLEAAVTEALAPIQAVATPREHAPPNPLTEREFQVAELVAEGLTNREIARRLNVAEWTAINHLRKVMRKLDCPSRVHVAGWFSRVRQGQGHEEIGSASATTSAIQ
ncbi:LuxR C-terminal-related transcriptional regulator [Lipingzhangella sp. LS1_29]|uniref:LuxR C-terminal-related transcriptional regulator n=1 Tax=Lipingzhangella rawalii TaxID=2055835 RepID=A0ABU2H665_9ACTN|nr:LuxR C-terminal-related transcriptional regulator [Lipingzhangella rawalii]MDS1270778.1 LuxR C-terminal-related transcriptional regulator [Lipingzhangella rawalii]